MVISPNIVTRNGICLKIPYGNIFYLVQDDYIYIYTQLYMDSSGQWQKNLRAVGQGTIPSSPSHVTMLRTTWRGWNPSRKGHFQVGDFTYSWFTTILHPYDWDDDVQLIFSRRSWSHQPSCNRNMSRVAVENLGRTRLRSFEDLRRQPTLLGTKPAKLDADMKPKVPWVVIHLASQKVWLLLLSNPINLPPKPINDVKNLTSVDMNLEALLGADCIASAVAAVAQEYERVAKSIQPEPNASISKLTRLGSEDRGDELKPTHTLW